MPAPAVYVLAVVGTVAAGLAFYEFVYEPHIAPKVGAWAHNLRDRRRSRQRQRAAAVPVTASARRTLPENESGDDDKRSFELEQLVSRQVRTEVDNSTIRQRKQPTVRATTTLVLDESNAHIPYEPLTPTHVISDSSDLSTSTSTLSSRGSSPSIASTMKSPSLPPEARLPTPDPSPRESTTSLYQSFSSPSLVPSLSLSHPVDLDQEHGVELLSAPSSRPDSPFSAFSQPASSISEYFSSTGSADGSLGRAPEDDVMSIHSQSSLGMTSGSEIGYDSRRSSVSDFSLISGTGGN